MIRLIVMWNCSTKTTPCPPPHLKPGEFTLLEREAAFLATEGPRGRILTAIDLSKVLDVTAVDVKNNARPVVSVIHANESYGLLTDIIGEVVTLTDEFAEPNPVNLEPEWRG